MFGRQPRTLIDVQAPFSFQMFVDGSFSFEAKRILFLRLLSVQGAFIKHSQLITELLAFCEPLKLYVRVVLMLCPCDVYAMAMLRPCYAHDTYRHGYLKLVLAHAMLTMMVCILHMCYAHSKPMLFPCSARSMLSL